MGFSLELALGEALGTIAEREEDMRTRAFDYLTKFRDEESERYFDYQRARQKDEKNIDRAIDALKAEGLTDNQIANGLNTYDRDFFAVAEQELKNFKEGKGKDNYEQLLKQDPTGERFRALFREEFDKRLNAEGGQRDLELDPVRASLFEPFDARTPANMPDSLFQFDYTKGVREDIAKLGEKYKNIPSYDAPEKVEGLSSVLSGTVLPVNKSEMYTNTELNRKIIIKLQKTYGELDLAPEADRFVTRAESTETEREQVAKANGLIDKLQAKFNEIKSESLPPSMQGGKTDFEILEEAEQELLGTGASGGGGDGGAGGGTKLTQNYTSNLTTHIDKFPDSPITKLVNQLKSNGASDDDVRAVLNGVVSGSSLRSLASKRKGVPIAILDGISDLYSAFDADDIQTIIDLGVSGTSATATTETSDQQAGVQKDVVGMARPLDTDERGPARRNRKIEQEAWDNSYGIYLNPDGTPKEGYSKAEIDAGLRIAERLYQKEKESFRIF